MARFTSYRRLSHESTTQDWERQSHCSFPHPAGQWRKPLDALDRCAWGDWYPCSDCRARNCGREIRLGWMARSGDRPHRQNSLPRLRCCLSDMGSFASLRMTEGYSKRQFPGFGDQILARPAVVLLLSDQLEACTFVNTAGGGEFTLGPEHDFLIAGFAGEVDTFLNQPLADSQAPGGRLDEQETEFGNRRGLLNKKHRPDVFRVSLGDPATLSFWIQVLDELGDDLCYESLEAFVIVVFPPVEFAVALDYPAHVAGAVLAKNVGRGRQWRWTQNGLDIVDGSQHFLFLAGREAGEHGGHLLSGTVF